jgi:hypothetical protein
MDVVENTLGVDLDAFLGRPRFCFLAQTSEEGPRVSPLWFLWEDGAVWIIAQLEDRSYPGRVERDPRTALAVVDFEPPAGRVEHVGMRGRASLEPYDAGRADRLLSKYLGDDLTGWPERFVDLPPEDYRLIRFEPETVVARDQSYAPPADPDLEEP